MNEQQQTLENKTNTVQAAANTVGKEGKVLSDNRNTTLTQKVNDNTIQRMEDDSIGNRKRKFSEYNKLTSRQKSLHDKLNPLEDNYSIEKRPKKKVKKNNLWNGYTRPNFTDDTWETMLNSVLSKVRKDGVTVYQCSDGAYYPRKRDRKKKESYVTLDHKKNWKDYIYDNAEPDLEGEITKNAAKKAYNDIGNLEVMSNSKNSSKSGPKNKYD